MPSGFVVCMPSLGVSPSHPPPRPSSREPLDLCMTLLFCWGSVLDTRSNERRTPQALDAGGRRLSMAQETLILTEENVIAVLAEVGRTSSADTFF